MDDKLKISFKHEDHGWFPIEVSIGDTRTVIDASDVPRDPILELIEAVEKCFLHKSVSEAWLHLEPCYNKFVFSPSEESVNFKIYFIEPKHKGLKESLELEYTGEYKELLFTFWRALKAYASRVNGYEGLLKSIENRVNELK